MIEDPETGKRLYADLLIREKVVGPGDTEIIDVLVLDTCTENDLAEATAASLRGIKIRNIGLLANVLKDKFRIFHLPVELLEAIQAKTEEEVTV